MHSEYVPLHLHTEFSLLDGAIRLDDLIAAANQHKIAALAMTDHGNLFGAIEFYKKVSSAGLKPIIGCETYIAPGSRFDRSAGRGSSEKSFHLILLCKDINGYRNLTRLVSHAYLEGFYYKPRIDKDLLEQHSGGLIGLSSCLKGEIPFYLSAGMIDKAREAALQYRRIFGADSFYLEIQANELPEQDKVNKQIIELSRELHIPLVATNDCHYLHREDARAHDVLLCIQTGKTLNDENRMRFSKDTFYFKSPEEMKEAFSDLPDAIENTRKVAEKCNLDFSFGEDRLPRFPVPDGKSADDFVRELAEEGLSAKLAGKVSEEYRARLDMELAMIKKMGFSSYFLIVRDFIHYAKSKSIPVGPGRGSAAGSLVAFSLDITDIDPIKYGLLFERFLNPERVSMPDIDVDFCMDRRNEVIDYVTDLYGKDHVAQIITFGTMQARAAIRDVGRVMNIPYSDVDRVAKLIPFMPKITIESALKIEPALKELYDTDAQIRELIEVAQKIEGMSRHASTHAAGIVISPDPLTDFLPLYKAPNDDAIVTQFDMDAIKKLGLLKFDFLGLKTLTAIDRAEKLINEGLSSEGKSNASRFSVRDIPLDDKKSFDLLCEARTVGVFQLESSGMKDLLKRLRPSVFDDMIALVALYRPGPLGSGMVDEFIETKNTPEGSVKKKGSLAKLGLEELDRIIKATHGIILYQEQVMEIAHKMAGFSLAEADILRKAMGGKNPDEMERMRKGFIDGLRANGVSVDKAEKLYKLILQFAQYGFNKSHSAAYALIAYQTAYLKAHYPVEFMAASLSTDMDNTAKVVSFINECRDMNIEILPPDINNSGREFRVDGNSIRFGLEAVKGVGSSAIDAVIEAREEGLFSSFSDFCSRVDMRRVNKKVIESLVKAGALDSMGGRAQLMAGLAHVMEAAVRQQKHRLAGQVSMFEAQPAPEERLPGVQEWSESQMLAMEKEALGFYITGHPLNKYAGLLKELSVTSTDSLDDLRDRQEVKLGGLIRESKRIQTKRTGDLMAYLTIEDLHGTAEVIVFPDTYRDSQEVFSMEQPVIVAGYTDKTDKGLKVIAQKIVPIEKSDEIRDIHVNIKFRRPAGGGFGSGGNNTVNAAPPRLKTLTLTMFSSTPPEKLPQLESIFERYSGDCPVYIKIVSPRKWETLLRTGRHVLPSSDLITELEGILGKKSAALN